MCTRNEFDLDRFTQNTVFTSRPVVRNVLQLNAEADDLRPLIDSNDKTINRVHHFYRDVIVIVHRPRRKSMKMPPALRQVLGR